jgi:hypothetical protein
MRSWFPSEDVLAVLLGVLLWVSKTYFPVNQ